MKNKLIVTAIAIFMTLAVMPGSALADKNEALVIKYDSAGGLQWARSSGNELIKATLDDGKFIYFGTEHPRPTHGYGISVDSNGNSYITGDTMENLDGQKKTGAADAFVIKYDNKGVKQWTRLVGAVNGYAVGKNICVDAGGNSYILVSSDRDLDGNSSELRPYFYLIKHDPTGERQWTKFLGKTAEGRSLSMDLIGNFYITGFTTNNLDGQTKKGKKDAFVIKYDSTGEKHWTRLIGVEDADTYGNGISIDSNGNCYVTGYTSGNLDAQNNLGYDDAFVIKFNSSGEKQWTKLAGPALYETANEALKGVIKPSTRGHDISVDRSGNCYVIGTTANIGKSGRDKDSAFIIKYDSRGIKKWNKHIAGDGPVGTYGYGIFIDSSDNCYVTGQVRGSLDGNKRVGHPGDVYVTKFDSTGSKKWTKLFGSEEVATTGQRISVDSNGNCYVVCNSSSHVTVIPRSDLIPEKEKLSYSIGWYLTASHVMKVNKPYKHVFAKGLADGISGAKEVTEDEMRELKKSARKKEGYDEEKGHYIVGAWFGKELTKHGDTVIHPEAVAQGSVDCGSQNLLMSQEELLYFSKKHEKTVSQRPAKRK